MHVTIRGNKFHWCPLQILGPNTMHQKSFKQIEWVDQARQSNCFDTDGITYEHKNRKKRDEMKNIAKFLSLFNLI